MAGEPTLHWGSEGAAVVDLQTRLTASGYSPGAIDGAFGPLTDAAVRQLQADRGLVVDGVVGPRTWSALDEQPVPDEVFEPGRAGEGAPGQLPASHVEFVEEPTVTGLSLTYRAASADRTPIAAGAHVDMWSIESDTNPMLASDTYSVPFTDAPDGAYDVALQLPDLEPGTYTIHVALTATAGHSEIGHATVTIGGAQPTEPPASHVEFVEEPTVTGLTLTYRATRADRTPIAAGAHVDMWSIESDTNPMLASDSYSVPFTDAPDGAYDVALQLPVLEPGTYTIHVALTATAGHSEIGHATFTT